MAEVKQYDAEFVPTEGLVCSRCNAPLITCQVTLSYMDSAFPVELPGCPKCGMVYIPESLATGKILHVEKSLEDK